MRSVAICQVSNSYKERNNRRARALWNLVKSVGFFLLRLPSFPFSSPVVFNIFLSLRPRSSTFSFKSTIGLHHSPFTSVVVFIIFLSLHPWSSPFPFHFILGLHHSHSNPQLVFTNFHGLQLRPFTIHSTIFSFKTLANANKSTQNAIIHATSPKKRHFMSRQHLTLPIQ